MINQVRKLKLNVTNIKSVLINSNKRLRTLEMKKSAFISKEDKKIKRLRKEEKIEENNKKNKKSIPIIGGVLGRVTGAVGNIKDRLLNFFGYLLIGFLINKLPQIISWVKTTWTKIKGLWDGLVNVLNIIGNGFKFLFDTIGTLGGLTGIKFVTRGLGNIANKFLNLQKDMDKNPLPKSSNLAEDDTGSINDSAPIEQFEIPEFRDGGIASGPEDRYLARLHGDEAIIPLDDNNSEAEVSTLVDDKPGTIIPLQSTKSKVSANPENKQNTTNFDNIMPKTTLLNNNVNIKNLNPLSFSKQQIAILPISRTRYIETPSSNNSFNINIASQHQPAPVSP